MHPFHRFYSAHFAIPPFGRWTRRNHASILDALAASAPPATILEVGCGDGRLSRQLAARFPASRVVAIDNDPVMVGLAEGLSSAPNLEYRKLDFRSVAFSCGCVVAAGVWEFFPLDWSARRALEVVAPGGVLVLNTVRPVFFARVHAQAYRWAYRQEVRPHEPGSLGSALERVGFQVRWAEVNPAEGSYTVVAHRAEEAGAGSSAAAPSGERG